MEGGTLSFVLPHTPRPDSDDLFLPVYEDSSPPVSHRLGDTRTTETRPEPVHDPRRLDTLHSSHDRNLPQSSPGSKVRRLTTTVGFRVRYRRTLRPTCPPSTGTLRTGSRRRARSDRGSLTRSRDLCRRDSEPLHFRRTPTPPHLGPHRGLDPVHPSQYR